MVVKGRVANFGSTDFYFQALFQHLNARDIFLFYGVHARSLYMGTMKKYMHKNFDSSGIFPKVGFAPLKKQLSIIPEIVNGRLTFEKNSNGAARLSFCFCQWFSNLAVGRLDIVKSRCRVVLSRKSRNCAVQSIGIERILSAVGREPVGNGGYLLVLGFGELCFKRRSSEMSKKVTDQGEARHIYTKWGVIEKSVQWYHMIEIQIDVVIQQDFQLKICFFKLSQKYMFRQKCFVLWTRFVLVLPTIHIDDL